MPYPSEIVELPTDVEDRQDGETGEDIAGEPEGVGYHAELHNNANAVLNELQATLGENPQGGAATVADRLAQVAVLGKDNRIGGEGGSPLATRILTKDGSAAQIAAGPLGATYMADSDEAHIFVNTSALATAANWTKGGGVGDSGAAFAAAFAAALAAQVSDPSEATFVRRSRKKIPIPSGAFYTAKPLSLMTWGGNRTVGPTYEGAGNGQTQIYFQPPVGNPRTFTDAEIAGSTLQSATAAFTAADVGHRVLIYQAGPGGGVFDAVITAYTNATTVSVGMNATTNVSGVTCTISPDAVLMYNTDKHQVTMKEIEFVGMQPTEPVPATVVKDGSMGVTIANATMAKESTTLTSATSPFTPDMVGRTITVEGAGAAGVTLTTTIATYNSASSVVLANANASGGAIAGKAASIFSNILQVGRVLADGAISSSSETKKLTSATASFTSADLGVKVGIAGAGAAGALLITTIQKIISGTEVLVAQAASTTVSGVQLTIAGKNLSGKFIGNKVEVAGAGPAGATLTATVRAIWWRDINGVPSVECLLSSACSTIVSKVQTTFNCTTNAILYRSTSNGGVVGPYCHHVKYSGAWADVHLLDGNNQNADCYWHDCELYDRPGTFLRLLDDPALANENDQQLDFIFDGGIWAQSYGDLVNFDGRGGHIEMRGGSQTIGYTAALTEDAGGVLPVALVGDVNDPGGTWFKLRDRSQIQNHRTLEVLKPRFEQRNDACCIRDLEWSIGNVIFTAGSDDSAQATSINTFFSRVGFLGVTGPRIEDIGCTWKGRHLFRYKTPSWRVPKQVWYRGCHLTQQEAAQRFAICAAIDTVSSEANMPVIHFVDGTRTNTAVGSTGYEDYADTDVNWQVSSHSQYRSRWCRWNPGGNTKGLNATGGSATMIVPFGAMIVRLHLYIPVVAGQSVNEDWKVKITDSTPTTIHTFEPGVDGIAAGTKWNAGIFAMIALATPFVCSTGTNRTLLAKVEGTGTTANISAWVAAEILG